MRRCVRQAVFVVVSMFCVVAKAESPSVVEGSIDTGVIPERRKEQFQKSFGYAVFPMPYSLPGIGSGVSLVGGVMNAADTYTDAYGVAFVGGVRGLALGVADIHLIPETLVLDLGLSSISKATIQSYGQRGMQSDKNDYRLLELGNTEYYGGLLTATFFDRRFEVYGARYESASTLKSIRDREGAVLVETQDAPRSKGHTTLFGARIDLTDDFADPRRGFSLDITRTQSPPEDSGPDFYVMDYNASAYVPVGKRSTLAFNAFLSDAKVRRMGETDPAVLQSQEGFDCSLAPTPAQQADCLNVVNNMVANNRYGQASSLGGFSRLRSYAQGRFSGAHTMFYGTEFRWNLTDETTPFDIVVMRDVRTAIQVAFFAEVGSTADLRSDLGKDWRGSYGAGVRMVTASGVVFRADLAVGRDGAEPQVFIGYPWDL